MRRKPHHLTDLEWQQLSLPRRYQVLTWQLNVSVYPPAKTAKYVSVLRDPVENTELHRRGAVLAEWADHLEVVQTHILNTYSLIEHVTGIDEPF